MHEIQINVRVRYPECDPMGVAHHSVFPIWMELARTDLLRQTGMTYRECEAAGVYFVVTKMSVSFKAPAHYDDELTIIAKVTQVSRVRIDHGYEIKRGDDLLATAETTLACVGADGRVRAIPDSIGGR